MKVICCYYLTEVECVNTLLNLVFEIWRGLESLLKVGACGIEGRNP